MGADDKTLAERAAAGAAALGEAERAKHAADEAWEREQAKQREAWLANACTPPSRGWLGFLGRKKGDVAGERAWFAALPFPFKGHYELLFDDNYSFDRWALRFEFAAKVPEETLVTNLFGTLPAFSVSTVHLREPVERRDLYVERRISHDERRAAFRAWHERLLFHRVVDEVLVPLHREYPIARIEIAPDHHKFNAG